jgi:hypothetical protein
MKQLARKAFGDSLGRGAIARCGEIYDPYKNKLDLWHLRRTAFLAAGGYDTDPVVLYNEDVAMHCSLARAGLRFSADREIFIINWRRAGSMSTANQVKCLRAQLQVLLKAKASDGQGKYSSEIAERLWEVATAAATYVDWETADESARIAFDLEGLPRSQSCFPCLVQAGAAARCACAGADPAVKPQYRADYPPWRLGRNPVRPDAARLLQVVPTMA